MGTRISYYRYRGNTLPYVGERRAWLHVLALLSLSVMLSSCGVTKYVPEGKYLSTKAKVIIENPDVADDEKRMSEQLTAVLRPKPNKRFLGGYPGLHFYYKNQKERPGFINRFFYKKIGEAPVYSSDVKTNEVEELLLNRLENTGYFYSKARSEVELHEKKKEAEVTYTVRLEKPYILNEWKLDSMPVTLEGAIVKAMENTLLKSGQRFDLGRFKAERERIDVALKQEGYYNFNGGFLIFEADTNQYADRRFDLYLGLKKGVPHKAIIPYTISEIDVYPALGLAHDSLAQDSIRFNGIDYIGGEQFFRADRLAPFITLVEGERYSGKHSKSTARRLSTIGVYRFVNIQHEILQGDTLGSMGHLRTTIELSPLNKRALRAELQAVSKSNNFAGPALSLSYVNRNLFKGGETLNTSGNIGYEVQVGGQSSVNYNLSVGVSTELVFPRLILPVKINADFFKYAIPKTRAKLSLDHSDRSGLYKLISATATFGYDWNAARYVTHRWDPISVNYNNLYQSSAAFEEILADNPFLQQSFDQQFIAGLNYSFQYNELIDSRIKNALYFNANFDMAGNMIGLVSQAGEAGTPSTVLGLDYAQYAKLDLDLRFHIRLPKEKTIAMRLFGGYGLPYGNSDVMPFIKQYYSGGPYGLRAFGIRAIGPGTFESEGTSNSGFFEQTGNIKLEANLEFRFPLFSYLKGAIFTDVGNIWLSEANPSIPGGAFGTGFADQLGMGAGVGLRIDVQGFVIRFDFAAPYHSPLPSDSQNYALKLNKTQFNFAIGYPF